MKALDKDALTIKELCLEDRPRERLKRLGVEALSPSELLAIILRSGSRRHNALEVSKRLLKLCDNNISMLASKSLNFLNKIEGMGEVKSLCVLASLELGRRLCYAYESANGGKLQIKSSLDVFRMFAPKLQVLKHEECWLLMCSSSYKVLEFKRLACGGEYSAVVDTSLIFRTSIESSAKRIAIIHNHPSGEAEPSNADINFTAKCCRAARELDITFMDHIIIAGNRYYSFADERKLEAVGPGALEK